MIRNYDSAVRVTDKETGESVTITNHIERSTLKQRDLAIHVLKNRLHALRNGIKRKDEVVASYIIPDEDNLYPKELDQYKVIISS